MTVSMFDMLTRLEEAKAEIGRGLKALRAMCGERSDTMADGLRFIVDSMDDVQTRLDACFHDLWAAHVAAGANPPAEAA